MKKGTIVSFIVIILVAGAWYLLKHFTSVLSKNYTYYGYYEDVKGLQASSGVFGRGVKIGKVSSVDLEGKRVKVTFSVRKEEKIPGGTVAVITPGDLLGGKAIKLEMGKGPDILPDGSFLKTATDTTFVENFDAKVTPVIEEGKFMLRVVDTGLTGFNYLLMGGWGRRTQQDIDKLYKTSNTLAKAAVSVNGKTGKIVNGINTLDSMTKDPTEKNMNINKSISSNIEKTDKLVKSDLTKQLVDLGISINKFTSNINKINRDTKGVGKLLNDKQPYQQANQSLDTINRSMQELQKDPPGVSIFGGKKKK